MIPKDEDGNRFVIINGNKYILEYDSDEINAQLVYRDVLCNCGCGTKLGYYKYHVTQNYLPKQCMGHGGQINRDYVKKKYIENGLIEIEGKWYFKDRKCACGCGSLIPFRHDYGESEIHKYIGNHQFKDPIYLESLKQRCNTPEAKEKFSNQTKEHYRKIREQEEREGYITIKGEKYNIIFIDGVKYFKDRICKCGCGKHIPITKSQVDKGPADYIYHHNKVPNSNKIRPTIIEDGIEVYADIFCKCGCGKHIPKTKGKYTTKYIQGHKFSKDYIKNNQDKIITINGVRYWKDRPCKCGCGKLIKVYNSHSNGKISEYIRGHDPLFIEKIKENGKKAFAKMIEKYGSLEAYKKHQSDFTINYLITHNGSYGQSGIFNSSKMNKKIHYDSSYELEAIEMFESDPNVTSYDRCHFALPCFYNNEPHKYIPDFMVEYFGNNTKLIEIKPNRLIYSEENIGKFIAGKEHCDKWGMDYDIWTEDELGI